MRYQSVYRILLILCIRMSRRKKKTHTHTHAYTHYEAGAQLTRMRKSKRYRGLKRKKKHLQQQQHRSITRVVCNRGVCYCCCCCCCYCCCYSLRVFRFIENITLIQAHTRTNNALILAWTKSLIVFECVYSVKERKSSRADRIKSH